MNTYEVWMTVLTFGLFFDSTPLLYRQEKIKKATCHRTLDGLDR